MTEARTCVQALVAARALGLDRLDAQLLLLHALGKSGAERAWLLAHEQDPLPDDVCKRFSALAQRLAEGEPRAYLVGQQEFFGLMLAVDDRVLIPRPDTETLVSWALDVLPEPLPADSSALDLGTGSGAVALAIKHARPTLHVRAIDASAEALSVARANANTLGLTVEMALGDWLEPVEGTFDVIVSNPPYVPDADPHLPALRHEPLQALTAGVDGLTDLRQIIRSAPGHLKAGGWLLLEHGYDQAEAVCQLLRNRGFTAVTCRLDLAGNPRCSGGCWPGPDSQAESAG
jgi:release factor glutamine methyltransferase